MQASAGVITGLPRIPRTAGSNKDGGAVHSYNAACCCSDCGLGHWFREDTAQCVRNYQYHHNYYYNHHPCAAAVCPGGRGKFHRFLKCVPPCRGERKQALQTVGGGSEVSEGAVMFRFIHTFLWMYVQILNHRQFLCQCLNVYVLI